MSWRGYLFVYEHTATGFFESVAQGLRRSFVYLMETEVHVFGFSIAANVLLSFIPFLVVMVSLARILLGREAEATIYLALRDYLPDFFGRNVANEIRSLVNLRGAFQWTSVLLLFFTANGIFEPLEVALNKAFGISTNRSFVRNQLVSMGLIFSCGGLMLVSTIFAAFNHHWMTELFGSADASTVVMTSLVIKTAALPATILALFLTYWILPNGPVPVGRVLKAAIGVGLLLELFKYLVMITFPWLHVHFRREYGMFYASASIILWSFLGSMIVLAGAEWAGREISDAEHTILVDEPASLGSVHVEEHQRREVDGPPDNGA